MTQTRFVLLGSIEEHLQLAVDPSETIIRVVDSGQRLPEQTPSWMDGARSLGGEMWLSEDLLPECFNPTVAWPTPEMIAAADDLEGAQELARQFGSQLRRQGIAGVWGASDGTLSDVSLPWLGNTIRRAVRAGFAESGVRVAWAMPPTEKQWWWMEGEGVVAPWTDSFSGTGWHWSRVQTFRNRYAKPEIETPVMPQPQDAMAILRRLRTRSIVLVDDPMILPLPPSYRFTVTGGPSSVVERELAAYFHQGLHDRESNIVSVWIDCLPSEPIQQPAIVVACHNKEMIAQAPPESVKIQVFDDHPDVWKALAEKLAGLSGWSGRLPSRLDSRGGFSWHSAHYTTEHPHPCRELRWLELQSAPTLMTRWLAGERDAIDRIEAAIPVLTRVLDRFIAALRAGGHIYYVGAGSAGRAGLMDAVELPPTFGVAPTVVQGVLAGGISAFQRAKEGVEDSMEQGREDILQLQAGDNDIVVGITAHGDTPYVLGALREAQNRGAATVALVNNRGSRSERFADEVVFVDSGPEVLVGSTRLKAGTVEKVVLNMLSSLAMIALGKSYDNFMTGFVATNDKLRERAVRVLMMATGQPRSVASAVLRVANGSLSVAIVMQKLGFTSLEAEQALTEHGSITRALAYAAEQEVRPR